MPSTAEYMIRVVGSLDEATSSWFVGLTICQAVDATTILTTPPIHQTTLHGILATLRDLAIPLIAACPRDTMSEDANHIPEILS
jgi:hypothetical protein